MLQRGNKSREGSRNVFMALVDDVKAALPSNSGRPVEVIQTLGSVRIISYQERESGAQIDMLLVKLVQNSYVISLYGWSRL